jgi:glycogen debranching enzyme
VERELLTPYGLRSLAPGEPGYAPHYGGGAAERDRAYHQGTVWPWLVGIYADACLAVRGRDGLKELRERIVGMLGEHLRSAGVGSVSELFDAEPPHTPRGCIAQAWSVAELRRVLKLLEEV